MKANDFMYFSFTEFLDSPLINRKSNILITVFIFLTSLFTGAFFSFCLSSGDKASLTDPIRQMFQREGVSLFPSLLTNVFLLLLVFLAGLTIYGFALSLIILTGKALSIGFCGGLLFFSAGDSGLKFLFLSLLPVNILLMCSLIAAVTVSLNYATGTISGRIQKGQYNMEYYILFIVFSLLVIMSSLLESVSMRII